MTQPLVSIALCTYNGEKFLAGQLDTLINQTYKNIEIIAVDDCSTDNTYAILQEYAAKYPVFTVYRNSRNVNFLKNFEIALSRCKGELIALCDQDDLWHPQKIELQVAAIGSNMVIYHDSEFIDEDSRLMGIKMSDSHNFYSGDEPGVFLLGNCVSGHAMLFKRELLKHALPFANNSYHDWWLTYVAVNIGTIDFIPQCLVKYRRHERSSTVNDILTESQRLKQDIKWLEFCAAYSNNKRPQFVMELLKLYKKRTISVTSIRLGRFLKHNIHTLFYIHKTSPKDKLRKVHKLFWGLKGNNFWYTYISPDPHRIIHYSAGAFGK